MLSCYECRDLKGTFLRISASKERSLPLFSPKNVRLADLNLPRPMGEQEHLLISDVFADFSPKPLPKCSGQFDSIRQSSLDAMKRGRGAVS